MDATRLRQLQDAEAALQNLNESLQQLESQKKESEAVMKELENSASDLDVYRFIGPLLQKQSQLEAKQQVQRRLEFINSEKFVLHTQLLTHRTRIEKLLDQQRKNLELAKSATNPAAQSLPVQ